MSIQETAILVQLSTHAWTGKKKDKQLSTDTCARQNADNDVVEAIIHLVPPGILKPIDLARGRAYRKHTELTLPYLDNGLRIIASDMYMDYREKMKPFLAEHAKTVDGLDTVWPDIMANKGKRLGNLANKYRLPTLSDVKSRFYITQDIMSIPAHTDFRFKGNTDEEIAEIQAKAAETHNAAMKKAMTEVWMRLAELVGNVAETMGQRDKKFHDSIITKVKNLCDVLPKYNLTGDGDLENIRKEVATKLANLDPEDLREIPNKRKQAAKDAEDVMSKIAQYMK